VRDVIDRFDARIRSIGDPDPPAPPLALSAVCGYLFRRAVPALVPVTVAVVGQFLFTSPTSGALTAAGVSTAAAGGVSGAALALHRRLEAVAAAVASAALLVGPPFAITGGVDELFAGQTGLFAVVTLFVAAVCYVETSGLSRSAGRGETAARAE